jgi:uncharacterized protein YbgA (DUF1722 family)
MAKVMNSTAGGKFPVAVDARLMAQSLEFTEMGKGLPETLKGLEAVFDCQSFCPQAVMDCSAPYGVTYEESFELGHADTYGDETYRLLGNIAEYVAAHPGVCGYVLVRDSRIIHHPSVTGLEEPDAGDVFTLFARGLQKSNPFLPLEDYSRLHNPLLRESFVLRVFAYADWLNLQSNSLSLHRLIGFYVRYKYLVMSRDVNVYRQIGQLLANYGDKKILLLVDQLMRYLMQALAKPATRAGQVNALEHIRGYLKRDLQKHEKEEISCVIELFREGYVSFDVPMTVLQHHFHHHPNTYIGEQLFMRRLDKTHGAQPRLGNGI